MFDSNSRYAASPIVEVETAQGKKANAVKLRKSALDLCFFFRSLKMFAQSLAGAFVRVRFFVRRKRDRTGDRPPDGSQGQLDRS